MGTDRYMEREHMHVERYARWEMTVDDKQVLSIYRSVRFNAEKQSAEELLWRGDVNEHTESLIKVMVQIIPDRPEPVLSAESRVNAYLDASYGTEYHDNSAEAFDIVNIVRDADSKRA